MLAAKKCSYVDINVKKKPCTQLIKFAFKCMLVHYTVMFPFTLLKWYPLGHVQKVMNVLKFTRYEISKFCLLICKKQMDYCGYHILCKVVGLSHTVRRYIKMF